MALDPVKVKAKVEESKKRVTDEVAIKNLKTVQKLVVSTNSEDLDYYYSLEKGIRAIQENPALKLLIEWAIQCGFDYDSIPEEYAKYKDEIKGMDYTEGLIYIAMKEVDNNKWVVG